VVSLLIKYGNEKNETNNCSIGNPFIFVEKLGYVGDVKEFMDIQNCSDDAIVLKFGHARNISDQIERDRIRYHWAKDFIELGHFIMPGPQNTDLAHNATSRFFQLYSKLIDPIKYPGVVIMTRDKMKYLKIFFNMMQTKYNGQMMDTVKQLYTNLMLKEWCVKKIYKLEAKEQNNLYTQIKINNKQIAN